MKLPPLNNYGIINNSFYPSGEVDTIEEGIGPMMKYLSFRRYNQRIRNRAKLEKECTNIGKNACWGTDEFENDLICCNEECTNDPLGHPMCMEDLVNNIKNSIGDPYIIRRIVDNVQ